MNSILLKLLKKTEAEKIHLNFCKTILGVIGRATNIAVMGELGRLPLKYYS